MVEAALPRFDEFLEEPARPVPPLREDVDAAIGGGEEIEINAAALVQRMMRLSLAFFASEVIRGRVTQLNFDNPAPPTAYTEQSIIAPHHLEWDEILRKHKQFCLIAPRDHGKCAVAGHLILRADGARIPIEAWTGGDVLALNTETLHLVPSWAPASQSNGKKRCLRIRTRTGRTETVTTNHPLRTFCEWRLARELKVGDRIAVPRELAIHSTQRVMDSWFLGVLTGDGGLTGGPLVLTAFDDGIVEAARAACASRNWSFKTGQKGAYLISNDWRRGDDSPRGWLRTHGLLGSGSYEKRVPPALFTACREDIADYIAGMIDTDGHVSAHAGGSVEIYSVSEFLLRDLQHLLIRLGVVSVLSIKHGRYKGAVHTSWRLTVRGDAILRLADAVNLRSKKCEALAALCATQAAKAEGGSVDLLPKEVYDLIYHSEDWFRKRGGPRFNKKYDLTRSKAHALADAEGNSALRMAAAAEILWDEVVEIEDAGEQETYFITVPGLENYVGDDIINHNSHLLTIALPIWEGWRRPGAVIAIISETQPQAEEQLAKLKLEVENNPRLSHLMDPTCWSATKIRFTNGSTIFARGFDVKIRGLHPHLIICDDVVSEKAMYSQLVRDRQENTFLSAIRNMLVPGGTLVVVGTPQSQDDLYGRLQKNPAWFFKRYAAINEETGEILWPERYSAKLLAERRAELGEIRFTREFLGRPISSGMSLFSDDLVKGEPFEHLMATLGPTLQDGSPARPWWVRNGVRNFYAGVDIARGATTKHDWFVIFVVGLDDYGNRWVVDIYREKGLSYKIQKAKIAEKSRVWKTELTTVESNNAQSIYGEELIQETDLPIYQHATGAEKHSLEKGIPSLRVLFENRKYRCPRGDDASIIATDQWIGEMQSWTFTKEKGVVSVAKHDDIAMAQWLCEIGIQRGEAFSFSFGEQPGDREAAELYEREEAAALLEGDDWITMGLTPADMAAVQGRRGNLDFGTSVATNPSLGAPMERPVHPLGPGVPLWGDLTRGRNG